MTTGPFEEPQGRFPVPVHEDAREARVEYGETRWTDLRPASPASGRG
ncbi:hypothetical protein [Streptomyces sp. NPDC088915]